MGAEPAHAAVRTLPVGRAFFADERGVMLRTTWHLDRGFLNMSIWQDTLCVATFQLQVADAARLAGFLVEGLGDATTAMLEARELQAEIVHRPDPPPPYPYASPSPVGLAATVGDAVRTVVGAVGEQFQVWAKRPR